MNDMYAKDISKKISSVKHDKQRKGLFIGGKPVYGYKCTPLRKTRSSSTRRSPRWCAGSSVWLSPA